MSPEYAYYGHVSTKSDMFSFGVIVLEIVTGRRNTSPSAEHGSNKTLLTYVWEKWRRGSMAEIVDASLGGQFARQEALACVQIGLLCVQKDPRSRPDASDVVLMLDGQSAVQQRPSRPAFYSGGSTGVASSRAAGRGNAALDARRFVGNSDTENGVTISELQPR
uniref:Protein kinase domain-containing protein n=1 Tax=Arundo donax TaxID=35708 RepID=A0A0A8ZQ46_ARUDO